jgi:LmeA-like phospholipid-binding
MEFFTILLSSLLGLFSPVGFIVDRVAEDAIRSQLNAIETLAVRVDNTPNYQLVQGKVDRVRIAGRGVYPAVGIRIAAVEVETDAIAVDSGKLQQGQIELEQPFNAGVRLVLTEADILQSPQINQQLRDLSLDFLGSPAQQLDRYDFVDPQVELLAPNRLRFQVELQSQQSGQRITLTAESGIQISAGRQLQLIEPTATVDGNPLPPQLINLLVGGVSQRLDLANLEDAGITARVLEWDIDQAQLSVAAFVSIDPQFIDSIN